jgi:rhodanese-related sulfurtransferase
MRVLMAALAVAFLGMPAPAAAQDEWKSPKLRIEWAEFKKLHDAKNVVIVDVRDAVAYEAARIPGSLNVPLPEVEKRIGELKKHGKPIVFYCA